MPTPSAPAEREGRERVRRALAEGRAAVGQERHLRDDRDRRGEAAHGAHRLGRLEQASERLQQDEVDAGFQQDARLLLEDLAHLRQVERSVRLDERAERPDRPGDEGVLAGGGFPGQARALAVDLLERVGPLVDGELDAVGVPRVGRDDPGARADVVVVDLADGVGVGQVQRRPRLVGGGAARGQQRPDRPVGEQDLFGDRLAEVFFHLAPNKKASRCERRRPYAGHFAAPLIFFSLGRIPDLAPVDAAPRCADLGCRGFLGPVPHPLSMRPERVGGPDGSKICRGR